MTDTRMRVAVVTGAGQGLGRQIALQLGAAGYQVAVVGRTESKVKETAAQIGERALAVASDLTDVGEVRAAFASIDARFGGIDVLINNAADYTPFLLEEASDEDIETTVAGTLLAPIYCIRESIPRMRIRGGGDILSISSQSVVTPQPFLSVYAAAKSGLETLSQGLRNELRGQGFRIMVVQIGAIAGASSAGRWSDGVIGRMSKAFETAGISASYSAPGVEPSDLAAMIVQAITAPRPVCAETVVLRNTE